MSKDTYQLFTHDALMIAIQALNERGDVHSRSALKTILMIVQQKGCEGFHENCDQLTHLIDVIVFG